MSRFDARKGSIRESLQGYNTKLDEFKCKKKKELKRVVLTNEAIQLHDEFELIMKNLNQFLEKYAGSSQRKPPVSSLETLLPDLVIAAVLWCEDDALVNSIKSVITSLKEIVRLLKKNSSIGQRPFNTFNKRFVELKKKVKDLGCTTSKFELQKNHDFLSQQIDERMSQMFTMGTFFVPISFLIFASAVTSLNGNYLGRVALMFASLSCYLVWFIMYLRSGKMNQVSYPLIHSLELMLGLSTHSSLFEVTERHRIVRIRQHIFYTAFFLLFTLWELFLVRLEDIPNLLSSDIWNPATFTFTSMVLVLVFCLLWAPSTEKRFLAVFSFLLVIWLSIFLTHFFPPFLAELTLPLFLILAKIWVVTFVLLIAIFWVRRKWKQKQNQES